MTEQMFELRISNFIADEVNGRQLDVYGSAFVKIQNAWDADLGHRKKHYQIKFTADEIDQIKDEAERVASPLNNWDGYLKVPFKALLKQIAKVSA